MIWSIYSPNQWACAQAVSIYVDYVNCYWSFLAFYSGWLAQSAAHILCAAEFASRCQEKPLLPHVTWQAGKIFLLHWIKWETGRQLTGLQLDWVLATHTFYPKQKKLAPSLEVGESTLHAQTNPVPKNFSTRQVHMCSGTIFILMVS